MKTISFAFAPAAFDKLRFAFTPAAALALATAVALAAPPRAAADDVLKLTIGPLASG